MKYRLLKFKVALPLFTDKVTVTGLVGAVARVTGNGTVLPGATLTVAGTLMESV